LPTKNRCSTLLGIQNDFAYAYFKTDYKFIAKTEMIDNVFNDLPDLVGVNNYRALLFIQ